MLFLAIKCTKPIITDASLSPSSTTINYDSSYTVTCNPGFKLSGGNKMKCGSNGFDQTPICIGKK